MSFFFSLLVVVKSPLYTTSSSGLRGLLYFASWLFSSLGTGCPGWDKLLCFFCLVVVVTCFRVSQLLRGIVGVGVFAVSVWSCCPFWLHKLTQAAVGWTCCQRRC